jgi:hypothetical protein
LFLYFPLAIAVRMRRADKGRSLADHPEATAMARHSPLGAAIRWFVYGAIVGVLIDLLIIWATADWHRWQTPTQLVANVLLVAVFGLMIQLFQDYHFRRTNCRGSSTRRTRAGNQCHE